MALSRCGNGVTRTLCQPHDCPERSPKSLESGLTNRETRFLSLFQLTLTSIPHISSSSVFTVHIFCDQFGVSDGDGTMSLWQSGLSSNCNKAFYVSLLRLIFPLVLSQSFLPNDEASRPVHHQSTQCHTKQMSDFVFIGSSSLIGSCGHSSDTRNVCLWDTLLPYKRSLVSGTHLPFLSSHRSSPVPFQAFLFYVCCSIHMPRARQLQPSARASQPNTHFRWQEGRHLYPFFGIANDSWNVFLHHIAVPECAIISSYH